MSYYPIDTHVIYIDNVKGDNPYLAHHPALKEIPTRLILENSFCLIGQAMQFMRLVIFGSNTSFADQTSMHRPRVLSPLGKMFRHLRSFADLYASGYSFHPLLRFFFAQYREDAISRLDDGTLAALNQFDLPLYDQFDAFVVKLRHLAAEQKLRKQIRDWESKYEKNSIRLKQLQERIFKRFGRVIVIRLDLHHTAFRFTEDQLRQHQILERARQSNNLKAYFTHEDLFPKEPYRPAQSAPLTEHAEKLPARVSFETVQRDRLRFFANMKGKPSLFKHAVAYAWRMEFTPDAGYHLHVVLFFDGSKMQKHEWYAEQIGKYWRDKITRGAGYFYNCNRSWSEHSHNYALGRVDHNDTRKLQNLASALEYLCKRTQQVVVMPKKNCNMFGSGLFHCEKKVGSGRPRIKVPTLFAKREKQVGKRYPNSSFINEINDLTQGGT